MYGSPSDWIDHLGICLEGLRKFTKQQNAQNRVYSNKSSWSKIIITDWASLFGPTRTWGKIQVFDACNTHTESRARACVRACVHIHVCILIYVKRGMKCTYNVHNVAPTNILIKAYTVFIVSYLRLHFQSYSEHLQGWHLSNKNSPYNFCVKTS